MSDGNRTIAWWTLRERGWPRRAWLGSATWVDGHRIFARIAPDGPEGSPPVVMLHGLVVSGTYFRPIATYLDGHYPLYIPDLPGHGGSNASGTQGLDETTAVLDRWMDAHGLREAVVVGNSTGCQVGTMLATRFPHRVSRLVMVAPTMDPAARGPLGVIWRGLLDIPRERQSLWRIWIPDLLAAGPFQAIRSLLAMLRDPQLDRLPSVTQPVLAVAGERDPICPVPWVEQFATLVRSGRCAVVPGAAHAMNYSAPAALGRIVTGGMRGQDAAARGTSDAEQPPR